MANNITSSSNYNMTFSNENGLVGVLDFNGPKMVFTGDADESAKLFFELIAQMFESRLKQEREKGQEQYTQMVVPPEAQTEAEKIAYCAGWWAALQKVREWES